MSNLNTDIPLDTPLRKTLLNRAATLITGQRQQDYGSPEENFQRIADFWNTHLKKKLKDGENISPRQVAEMMMLLKLARTINSPTEDSYVDAAGYAGIAGELAAREEADNQEPEKVDLASLIVHHNASGAAYNTFNQPSTFNLENNK